jgi:hypothetical protein
MSLPVKEGDGSGLAGIFLERFSIACDRIICPVAEGAFHEHDTNNVAG